MAGSSGFQALKTISSEIDESQIKVIISTQYIKAQGYLVNKLRKKAEQNKERCSSIFTANLKLQSEITQAQQEITSLLMAQDTIKKANVELKKEYLLTKEKKLEVIERVNNGEKKYEDLWLESKARYESLHFVQKLLKDKDEVENIKHQINELQNAEKMIFEEMKTKTETCHEIDRKRIIELAEFMVIEMPKNVKLIREKSVAINKITKELDNLVPKANDNTNHSDNADLKADNDCTSIMPKLQLNYFDFDNLNANLDKIKSDDTFIKTPEKTYSVHSIMVIDPSKVSKKKTSNTEEFISSFFYQPIAKYAANKRQNYAKKKLINILDDIKIGQNEAQKMIEDVNPLVLQSVDSISADVHQNNDKSNEVLITKDGDKPESMEIEEIEEIDLTASGTEKMIMPPTQFLDITPELHVDYSNKVPQNEQHVATEELDQASTSKRKNSQEEPYKKKPKFDSPINIETKPVNDAENIENEDDIEANETTNSQLDVSDEGFAKIKDMIMKKHNLDLSPQFVYAKNVLNPLNLPNPEDAVITSEFFPQDQKSQKNTEVETEAVEIMAIEEDQAMSAIEVVATANEIGNEPVKVTVQDKHPPESVSSAKIQKVTELTQADKPISGSLFGQSSQMTTDFLDESTNTTVFEDGDDFPSCLDSSLLLSPKADLSMPNIESQEVLSQEVPNFLAGLRKTGLSFFGCLSSENKPDSSGQNQNQGTSGFSFNFGGEEKKNRGGLFSMFQ